MNKTIIFIDQEQIKTYTNLTSHLDGTKQYINDKNIDIKLLENNHTLCTNLTLYDICIVALEEQLVICYLPITMNKFQRDWFMKNYNAFKVCNLVCMSREIVGFKMYEQLGNYDNNIISSMYNRIKEKSKVKRIEG